MLPVRITFAGTFAATVPGLIQKLSFVDRREFEEQMSDAYAHTGTKRSRAKKLICRSGIRHRNAIFRYYKKALLTRI